MAEGAETFRGAADAYDRFMGRYSSKLAQALIGVAALEPGQSALDVGCGPGALTAALAERLGGENVAAADPSESFAAACTARVEGVTVVVARAERLPFPDASFDAALAQLVVNFMDDAPAGVGEMARVTRPGGTVAAAVWDYAGGMTLLRAIWDAAAAIDPAAGERDEGRSMPYANHADLSELWRGSGLTGVEVEPAQVAAAYRDFDDLWQPLESGVGPAGAYVKSLEAGRRDELRAELARRLGVGSEPFELTARAWCVTGRVSAETSDRAAG